MFAPTLIGLTLLAQIVGPFANIQDIHPKQEDVEVKACSTVEYVVIQKGTTLIYLAGNLRMVMVKDYTVSAPHIYLGTWVKETGALVVETEKDYHEGDSLCKDIGDPAKEEASEDGPST